MGHIVTKWTADNVRYDANIKLHSAYPTVSEAFDGPVLVWGKTPESVAQAANLIENAEALLEAVHEMRLEILALRKIQAGHCQMRYEDMLAAAFDGVDPYLVKANAVLAAVEGQ